VHRVRADKSKKIKDETEKWASPFKTFREVYLHSPDLTREFLKDKG
jgi:hypothetical protein